MVERRMVSEVPSETTTSPVRREKERIVAGLSPVKGLTRQSEG